MKFIDEKFDTIDIQGAARAAGIAEPKRTVIRLDGHIDAGGGDNKIYVLLNEVSTGYRSFAVMDGDAGHPGWETRGFYLGRNGFLIDADFSFSITMSLMPGRKRVYHAISTFAHADEKILGYACHGFWNRTTEVVRHATMWKAGPGRAIIDAKKVIVDEE